MGTNIYKGVMSELQDNKGLVFFYIPLMISVFIMYWLLLNIDFGVYLWMYLLAGVLIVTMAGACIFLMVDRVSAINVSMQMPDARRYTDFFNKWWEKNKYDPLLQLAPNLYTARVYSKRGCKITFITSCIDGKVYQGVLKAPELAELSKGDILYLNVVGDQFSLIDLRFITCLV